ncbi:hypothetical protein AVEN_183310-1 [Araneus ventricosus]|uniref:Uncharacterized protein n=1 Tax=Araneus ventricosus TaxID=182803 RepID=A0A4Y2X4K4_ARAVE|nr:hypothetical protein AVEN_183310-1 [Araneus ventricosus]
MLLWATSRVPVDGAAIASDVIASIRRNRWNAVRGRMNDVGFFFFATKIRDETTRGTVLNDGIYDANGYHHHRMTLVKKRRDETTYDGGLNDGIQMLMSIITSSSYDDQKTE